MERSWCRQPFKTSGDLKRWTGNKSDGKYHNACNTTWTKHSYRSDWDAPVPPPRQYCLGTEVASSNRWMYSGVLEGFWDAPTPTIITTPTTQVLWNVLKVISVKFVIRWLQVVHPRSKLSQARASRRNLLKKRPKDKVGHNSLPYLMLVLSSGGPELDHGLVHPHLLHHREQVPLHHYVVQGEGQGWYCIIVILICTTVEFSAAKDGFPFSSYCKLIFNCRRNACDP